MMLNPSLPTWLLPLTFAVRFETCHTQALLHMSAISALDVLGLLAPHLRKMARSAELQLCANAGAVTHSWTPSATQGTISSPGVLQKD